MTTDRLHFTETRLQLPMNPIAHAPDEYKAFGLANFYGEVIGMLRLQFSDDMRFVHDDDGAAQFHNVGE